MYPRLLKIPHIIFSSEMADKALNQVEQKSSKHHWMLSGKTRQLPAAKQKLTLCPVPLPKLGYIQITVTEVQMKVKYIYTILHMVNFTI